MTQTASKWFALLDSPVQEQAIANTTLFLLGASHECLADAISMSFTWTETPEGWSYWDKQEKLAIEKYGN